MATRRKKTGAEPGTRRTARRRRAAEPASRGLGARELGGTVPPPEVEALERAIESDGGSLLGVYRDPIGGHWQVLAGLPLERVVPTPFQRDLSEAHVKRLTQVVEKLDRYLDPVIAVRTEDGAYWTPNGHHRTAAVRALGGRAIVALVLPEREAAYKILALNTEKAHNLREKALEVVRMARELAGREDRPERDYALEFEEAPFVTLGLCYEGRGRFSGGAYHSVLRRIDDFLDEPLPAALGLRERRAARVLELDEAVDAAIAVLKARGFESPYLRAFVVARVNPLRFQRGARAEFDPTMDRMLREARGFDAGKVRHEHLARAAGPPPETE